MTTPLSDQGQKDADRIIEELRPTLLTVDGAGKAAKEAALRASVEGLVSERDEARRLAESWYNNACRTDVLYFLRGQLPWEPVVGEGSEPR